MLNFLIDLVPYRYVLSLTYIDDNVFQIWTREYLLMNPSYSGVIVVISKDGKNIWGWGGESLQNLFLFLFFCHNNYVFILRRWK